MVSPCSESWSDMSGTERERFCAHCQRSVVNLSAHTELGARWLLARTEEGCVRYDVAPDGRVRFRRSREVAALAALVAWWPLTAAAEPPEARPEPPEITIRPTFAASTEVSFTVLDDIELEVPLVTLRILPTLDTAAPFRVLEIVTDKTGRAQVDLPPGIWRVEATREGFVGTILDGVRTGTRPTRSLRIVIEPGRMETIEVGRIRRPWLRLPRFLRRRH